MVAFVGLGNCVVDLWLQLRSWLYRPVPATGTGRGPLAELDATRRQRRPAVSDWASVLYYGTTDAAETAVIASGRPEVRRQCRRLPSRAARSPERVPRSLGRRGAGVVDLVRGASTSSPCSSRSVDLETDRPGRLRGPHTLRRRPLARRRPAPRPRRAIGPRSSTRPSCEPRLPPLRDCPDGVWVSINVSSGARRSPRPARRGPRRRAAARWWSSSSADVHADPVGVGGRPARRTCSWPSTTSAPATTASPCVETLRPVVHEARPHDGDRHRDRRGPPGVRRHAGRPSPRSTAAR